MTPEKQKELAPLICADLCKKFRQLAGMNEKTRERILAGLVDGLAGANSPYPTGDHCVPPIRPAFDHYYEVGYNVGETWARIAKDWPPV